MLTLYSYPELFGLPDNNPFGLKVDTFLRLAKINYNHEHIVDTKNAPRGQLPYIKDNEQIITDSNKIIHYLSEHYKNLDTDLTAAQKNLHFLVTSMLDNHLYWVMSYSRWQDDACWPLFKAEFLRNLPELSADDLEKFRTYNIEKYHYQGIGRYSAEDIYQAGVADLKAISFLLEDNDFIFGNTVHALDACCYGFLANIVYFEIPTPLKDFVIQTNLNAYVIRIRKLLDY
ncbi:Uncharacterised protein [Legionella beliardensis]|uniref:GST N-terminal domain-containing protein n=1 Tax=Legionella beliardensis TaxID=91822 RepID=A0A378I2T1_9GAMM|nr:glutathione S-transferase family protein [Legionella beliardensis]STX29005.1 Uncharacterised protein [Legionella beliardensis]